MNVLPRYRPDIDGLRAVAVAAVVGFHAFPEVVPGGFVGVDVFFVISGFLISTIIFENLRLGRFDYAHFYVRRIKRLFPALFTVLAATILVAHFVAFPDEYRQTGSEAFAGAAFVSNLLFMRQGAEYFNAASEFKPLLHLWSLGIEEQFYLLWPLSAAFLFHSRRLVRPMIVLLLVTSFALSVSWSLERPGDAFYSPITRFWELMLGAFLAHRGVFVDERPNPPPQRMLGEVLGLAGFIFIVGSVALIDRHQPFPGWRALLPTAGTALLILAGRNASLNRYLLSAPALVFVGMISYPLYLWHWPILSFLRMTIAEPPVLGILVAVAASVLLAWLTFRFVESPIRFRPAAPVGPLHLCLMMGAIAAMALLMRADAFPHGVGERAEFVEKFENSYPNYRYIRRHGIESVYRLDCDFYDFLSRTVRRSIPISCTSASKPRSVMIWGDSHAQSISYGIRSSMPVDVGVLQVATSGCRPDVRPVIPNPHGVCNQANQFAMNVIRRAKPDLVILAQAREHEMTDWDYVATQVKAAGARHVLLLGPLPQWNSDLHKIIARRYWDNPPRKIGSGLHPGVIKTDRHLRKVASSVRGYAFLSLIERLCDSGGCIAFVNGDRVDGLIAFDYGHLTRRGSELVGHEIIGPAVTQLLRTGPR